MMRNVVLYIAMSLDGYVADDKGGVDWLGGDNTQPEAMGSYPDFINTVDTVILGWNTYHQIVTELSPETWVYAGMKSYVLTHREMTSTEEIVFTSEGLEELMDKLRKEDGKDIWICGGASVVNQLIKSDSIDKYHITIIPTILGKGVPLFEKGIPEKKLKLLSTQHYNGMTDLVYELRK